jgi:hypothetical protein
VKNAQQLLISLLATLVFSCLAQAQSSAPPLSLAYHTIPADNGVLKLEWLGECPYDADELVTAAFEATSSRKLKAAEDWLRVRLGSALALSKVVEKEAAEMGISARTLARARKQIGVISQPSGLQGEWVISLPARSNLSLG